MKYLVTGGAGFIGSHVCDRLVLYGENEVVAVDDLSTGSLANLENIHNQYRNFRFVRASILDEGLIPSLINGVDVVIHLAAAVGVKKILDDPVESLQANVRGTEIVLRWAQMHGARVFLASTSEVYGKSTKRVLREGDDVHLGSSSIGRWSYACAKLADEFLALAMAKRYGLRVVVGRLFNVVGPRQVGTYGMVLPRFIDAALDGRTLEVYGDGKQVRTFTSVRDAVTLILRLLDSPAACGQVVNVGSKNTTTIDDLATLVLRRVGRGGRKRRVSAEKVYGPDFEDMPRRVPCMEKMYRLADLRSFSFDDLESIVEQVIADKIEGRRS